MISSVSSVVLDILAAVLAIMVIIMAAMIRRLLALHDYIRGLAERIAFLEAKINGKGHDRP